MLLEEEQRDARFVEYLHNRKIATEDKNVR